MKIQLAGLSLSLSLLLTAAAGAPVWAQGTSPFWYLYMGQSLLYPLTRTVGLGGAFRYGPYNANPFFSTGSYVRNLNSKAIQWPYIYPYANSSFGPWGYRNAGMMPGTTGNNTSDNTQTFSAADEPDSANPAANTMNSANPYLTPGPGQNAQQATGPAQAVPTSGGAPAVSSGAALPSWSPPASAPPVASSVAASAPPVAPAFVPAATTSASAGLGRPLAEGFINHLNSNYQGDMSKALSNNDTRSWARAMGVIDGNIENGSHLSGDRIEVIGRVLKDNTLDPLSKLDTMRILLKKTPEPSK
ncbi:MAG: hypothetical protein JSS86_01715 [Cyanobacteria bacterium SZAS LIN-2]|nr:hypothetical protein [Cyanobacteria bacterium SZAS LIN-2]